MAGDRDYLRERDGGWYYWRRVPVAFAALDRRTFVRISLKIAVVDDPKGTRAARAAERANAETEAYWRGLAEGRAVEAETRYRAARDRAKALGFDYVEASQFSDRPSDLIDRLRLLMSRRDLDVAGDLDTAAVLGGEPAPEMKLSGLVDAYETLQSAGLKPLSPDQLRKWRNPKRKAVENLISIVGDKALGALARRDALEFRTWWQGRVVAEGVDIGTANKDIGHINRMLTAVEDAHQLGLAPVFSRLRIEGETTEQRAAFDRAFVESRILAPDALASLNVEARAIVHIIAETGMRLSEAANLTAATIRLDDAVPHVSIEPEGRVLKTPQSRRTIPLVGVALAAARAFPGGFPRYRDKAARLSAVVNKAMEAGGLRPTPEHSLYSLRHTFEDRLTAVDAPEKLIAALMGHKYYRPKYGAGFPLAQKLEWLERIAFKPSGPAPSDSTKRRARSAGASAARLAASCRSITSKTGA